MTPAQLAQFNAAAERAKDALQEAIAACKAAIALINADRIARGSDPFARIEASEKIQALGTTPEKYGFEKPTPPAKPGL
jgi:hypothetical protein